MEEVAGLLNVHNARLPEEVDQIDLLNAWLKELIETDDTVKKRELLRRIVVVGAYLKRRNNLFLVAEQDGTIKEEELNLSMKEVMKSLQLSGINCACSIEFDKRLPADVAMQLFDFYEYVLENAFDGLSYVLARFFQRDQSFYVCIDVLCSVDLRTIQTEKISVSEEDENYYTLSFKVEGGDGR